MPSLIVLIVLAIPPLMAGAYAGVEGVDPAARDAAKGMGMTGLQVLGKVEVPNALPLIFSGFRSATLQVIATATLAAVAGTGGLGRFLIDGQKIRDYPQMAGGAFSWPSSPSWSTCCSPWCSATSSRPGSPAAAPDLRAGPARRSPNRNQGNTPLDVDIPSSARTVDPQTP